MSRRSRPGLVLAALLPLLTVVGGSRPAASASPEAPTATPIRHLVVIFSENRSFDHYFGAYPVAANPQGEPRFVADPTTPAVDGLTPSLITSNPNQTKPFRIDPKPDGSGVVTCSSDHGYRPEQRAVNAGRMNRFVQETGNTACVGPPETAFPNGRPGGQVMGYFDGNTVTALWNYAQHFALNDASFGTTYGPSTPGALNLVSGDTSHALVVNRDGTPGTAASVPDGTVIGDPDPYLDDCSTAVRGAQLTGRNVGDLLNAGSLAAGIPVTWGWFEGGFAPTAREDDGTPGGHAVCGAEHANLLGNLDEDYEPHHEPFQYYASTANPDHLPPGSLEMIGQTDQANHQYDLADFWAALDAGRMPAVSFLKARGFEDGHPGPKHSDPLDEQHFIVDAVNRIAASPEWATTAIVIAYDDSDGIYDHRVPPNVHRSNDARDGLYASGSTFTCMPPGATVENAHLRCGYGPRLPLLVVSPFARQNAVDHTQTDQTSILRFIEDNWGLGRIGGGSFDVDAGSLLGMFDFDHAPAEPLFLQPCTGLPNTAPTVDFATVSPDAPGTDDVLTATAASSDPDPAMAEVEAWPCPPEYRDSVVQRYRWQRETDSGWADIPGATGAELDLAAAGTGDKGDRIRIVVTPNDGIEDGADLASAPVTVANTPPAVSVAPAEVSAQYGDPIPDVDVSTSDADGDIPSLTATGLPDGVTLEDDLDGTGVVSGTPTAPAGSYVSEVSASDGTDVDSTSLAVTVTREDATAVYGGALFFGTGARSASSAEASLSAHVTQAADGSPGNLARARVLFDLYRGTTVDGHPDVTVGAAVGSDGSASASPTLAAGDWTVVVRFDPANEFFAGPDSDPVTLRVWQPDRHASAEGAGWVEGSSGGEIFRFDVELSRRLETRGAFGYAFRGDDGLIYELSRPEWDDGGIDVDQPAVVLGGSARLVVVDPVARTLVSGPTPGYRFRIDATGGKRDSLAVVVYAPGGAILHRLGTPDHQVRLKAGKIEVRPGRPGEKDAARPNSRAMSSVAAGRRARV